MTPTTSPQTPAASGPTPTQTPIQRLRSAISARLGKLRTAKEERTASAAERYSGLIQTSLNPKPGDDEALDLAARELGLTLDHVASDLEAWTRHEELADAIALRDERDKAATLAGDRAKSSRDTADAAERDAKVAASQFHASLMKVRISTDAIRTRKDMQQKHPRVFNITPTPPEEPKAGMTIDHEAFARHEKAQAEKRDAENAFSSAGKLII